jgi:hypothetical protein
MKATRSTYKEQKHLEGEEEDTRHNRVIGKVRKRQGQYVEFGHTQGEISLKTC